MSPGGDPRLIHIVSVRSYPPDEWPAFRRKLLYLAYSWSDNHAYRTKLKEVLLLAPRQLRQPGFALVCGYVRTEVGPELAGFSLIMEYGARASIVAVRPVYRGHGLGARLFNTAFMQSSRKRRTTISYKNPVQAAASPAGFSAKAGELLCSPS
jgi:GNAT superfamily N-acetyltransferase